MVPALSFPVGELDGEVEPATDDNLKMAGSDAVAEHRPDADNCHVPNILQYVSPPNNTEGLYIKWYVNTGDIFCKD